VVAGFVVVPAVVVAGFVVVPAVVVSIEDGWAAVVTAVEVRVVVGLDAPVQRFTDPDACAQVHMWKLQTYTVN
jgi:hypothetical protein